MTRLQPLCFRPETEDQARAIALLAWVYETSVSEMTRRLVADAIAGEYQDTINSNLAAYDQAQQQAAPAPAEPPATGDLSPREAEAVYLTAGGLTNARIGGRMGITEATVGNYLSIAMGKLGLDNRAQLALYAMREGLENLGATT